VTGESLKDLRWQPIRCTISAIEFGKKFSRCWPLSRFLGQAPLGDRPNLGWDVIQCGRGVDHAINEGSGGPCSKRRLSGSGEYEHGPQAEHITCGADLSTLGLFG
jgi:hypothetical protein